MDQWNDADADEVTSKLTISNLQHVEPATGKVVSKINQPQRALAEAKASTMVNLLSLLIHIPSPRDLGRVSITRPESLNFLSSDRTTANFSAEPLQILVLEHRIELVLSDA